MSITSTPAPEDHRRLDNAAQIKKLERALAERHSRALESSLRSLYKVRAQLEAKD